MISVSEGKSLIRQHARELNTVPVVLSDANGKVLAEDVYAAVDIPNYPQSSMDGYAFHFDDFQQHGKLIVNGEMAAGSADKKPLPTATAVRIFTGAAVPEGADTVVMQEKTIIEGNHLLISDEQIKKGNNVRLKGSEIKSGSLALSKGHQITPATIGFMAGFGITELMVYRDPGINIIVTGNELQSPGKPLQYGQVYESNSFTLSAALKQAGIQNVEIYESGDHLDELTETLKNCLSGADVVILTGGVSVGDYDFTLKAAEACGVKTIFHKIKQRPGKPIFFGTKEEKLVFGLPGNPASVLTCFYEYICLALELMNHRKSGIENVKLPLSAPFSKVAGLTHFLKGFQDGKSVRILDAQESFRMHSFARANCLVQIDENITNCGEGEMVEIHCLP